jgi:Flp pilus assembly protein TadD
MSHLLIGVASFAFRTGWAAPALVAGLLLAACAAPSGAPLPGLAPAEPPANADASVAQPAEIAAPAGPYAPGTALTRARALRVTNKPEALAVLDKASADKPGDRGLQLERGLLAFELGDIAKAEKLLRQAHDPKAPDWRLHSALGATLATRGKQQEAQVEFAKALALAPDQPSVLNNLALSYALDGKTAEAEQLLRKAQRSAGKVPHVRGNLALVLGLRGRYDEARSLGAAALPALAADGNVTYLRDLSQAKSAGVTDSRDGEGGAPRRASASLPQPTYQLGGPSLRE